MRCCVLTAVLGRRVGAEGQVETKKRLGDTGAQVLQPIGTKHAKNKKRLKNEYLGQASPSDQLDSLATSGTLKTLKLQEKQGFPSFSYKEENLR